MKAYLLRPPLLDNPVDIVGVASAHKHLRIELEPIPHGAPRILTHRTEIYTLLHHDPDNNTCIYLYVDTEYR